MASDNVIDLKARLKTAKSKSRPAPHAAAPIIDMTERRQEILSEERRRVRRTILSEFVGAFAVVPEKGLIKVTLYDISEGGLSFDTDHKVGQFGMHEEIAMRVYLNHQTYFPFVVRIQNVRSMQDEGTFRHGGHFVKGTVNDKALHHFVKFIESVSATLHKDDGDLMVSGLTK